MAPRPEGGELVHRSRRVAAPAWRPRPKKKYKARDPKMTSKMMARVSGKDNRAEKELRSLLWRMGFRFRLQARDLLGRPDIVFPKYRAVVFVDGDFWHGRALVEGGRFQLREVVRSKNFMWWAKKLEQNVARDMVVNAALNSAGWKVVRVWESDIVSQPAKVVIRVARILRSRLRIASLEGLAASKPRRPARRGLKAVAN